MYGSLRRRFGVEKNKIADNVHVAMEYGDQMCSVFVLRLYDHKTTFMAFFNLRLTWE